MVQETFPPRYPAILRLLFATAESCEVCHGSSESREFRCRGRSSPSTNCWILQQTAETARFIKDTFVFLEIKKKLMSENTQPYPFLAPPHVANHVTKNHQPQRTKHWKGKPGSTTLPYGQFDQGLWETPSLHVPPLVVVSLLAVLLTPKLGRPKAWVKWSQVISSAHPNLFVWLTSSFLEECGPQEKAYSFFQVDVLMARWMSLSTARWFWKKQMSSTEISGTFPKALRVDLRTLPNLQMPFVRVIWSLWNFASSQTLRNAF